MRKTAMTLLLAGSLLGAAPALAAADRERETIEQSLGVIRELQSIPDQQAPDWLLQRAEGIAILPEVVKAGLFVGIGAGSIGWQFGVQASDIVLVFTTRQSVEGITDGKLTLGGDASVAAGPVGRTATAATSITLDAEVYSYSRSAGLFAGVSLEGSYMFIRRNANERFYGKPGVAASEILAPTAPRAPAPAPELIAEVARITAPVPAAPATAAPAQQVAAPATAPAGQPAATPPAETRSFPMADPDPGAEPPR